MGFWASYTIYLRRLKLAANACLLSTKSIEAEARRGNLARAPIDTQERKCGRRCDRFAILDLYNYVPSNRLSWTISEIPFVGYDHDFARLLACNHRTRHPCLPSHEFYKYNSLRSFDKHIQAATSFCVLLVTIIRFVAVLNPSPLQLKAAEPF